MTVRFMNSFRAAQFLGFEPASASSRDPEMRAFYDAARSIPKHYLGRRVRFAVKDLEAALERREPSQPIAPTLSPMQTLAAKHARGEALHMRARRSLRAVAGGRS